MPNSQTSGGPEMSDVEDAAASLKDTGKGALSQAKAAVSEAVSGVAAQAGERIASTRNEIADQGERMAESLRDASSRADGDGLQSRVFDTMASGVSSMTDILQNADGSAMIGGVQRFAQRNPVLFATGAAIAGLMIARALSSSGPGDGSDRSQSRHDHGYDGQQGAHGSGSTP